MKKRRLYNLNLHGKENYSKFIIDSYTFQSTIKKPKIVPSMIIYTRSDRIKYHRQNKETSIVKYSIKQKNSVIFKGGLSTQFTYRKRLDDILIIISLLIGRNVEYSSRKKFPQFPLAATNHLELVSWTWGQLSKDTKNILKTINQKSWRNKYYNGFHLRMLFNHSNIFNEETRFLSMVVIWEWLYAREFGVESFNLNEIITELLKKYFGRKVNTNIFNHSQYNIFVVIRNQLAHSGMLPIDRSYAINWMKALTPDEIGGYLKFFTHLTQILVFKTLKIEIAKRKCFKVLNITDRLDKFLYTSQI